VQAFRQIAQTKSPYVIERDARPQVPDRDPVAAGRPSKDGWFIDPGISKRDAIALAAERGAYVFWGLTPTSD
jgi:hypothetical protein